MIHPEWKIPSSIPENAYGFVYKITNNLSGKIYIGKKAFTYRIRKKKVGKRAVITYKTSDWKKYWGSSKYLKEDLVSIGYNNFSREILEYFFTKSQLSYGELLYQVKYNVLTTDSYNEWISVKIFKKNL